MEGGDGDGRGNWDFGDGSLVEEGKGGLGDLKDNALKEALAFGGTAFLDLDGDGSLVEVGMGGLLVEECEFLDGSLVEVGGDDLVVFDSVKATFDLGGSGGWRR